MEKIQIFILGFLTVLLLGCASVSGVSSSATIIIQFNEKELNRIDSLLSENFDKKFETWISELKQENLDLKRQLDNLTTRDDKDNLESLHKEALSVRKAIFDNTEKITNLVEEDFLYRVQWNSIDLFLKRSILANLEYNDVTVDDLNIDIVKEAFQIKSLEIIQSENFRYNSLNGLNHLKKLENLTINDVILSNSDIENILSLASLKTLYLRNVGLDDLKLFGTLQNLKFLDVTKNNITSLDGLEYLKKLERLYVEDNPIRNINAIKGLVRNKGLKQLQLSTNDLNFLEIIQLKSIFDYSKNCNLKKNDSCYLRN